MFPFYRLESLHRVVTWLNTREYTFVEENISVYQSLGRVLSKNAVSTIDVPMYDSAAVDGYAIRGGDASTYLPSHVSPLLLQPPSETDLCLVLSPGTASRIEARARLPQGTEEVISRRYAEESEGQLWWTDTAYSEETIFRRGRDILSGQLLELAGRRVGTTEWMLLTALGCQKVAVFTQPRVEILIAKRTSTHLEETKYYTWAYEANRLMLHNMVKRDGGILVDEQHDVSTMEHVKERISSCNAEILLIVGSSGEGWHDYASSALKSVGELIFHGIGLEPGRSTGIGQAGKTLLFLMPDHPLACRCAYDALAGPALRRMAKLQGSPYFEQTMTLTQKVVSPLGRVDCCFVQCHLKEAKPLGTGTRLPLSSLIEASGFFWVPEHIEGYPAGEKVSIYCFN